MSRRPRRRVDFRTAGEGAILRAFLSVSSECMRENERAVRPVWAIGAVVLLTEMILASGGGVLVSNAHRRRNRDKLNRSIPQAEVREWTGSS